MCPELNIILRGHALVSTLSLLLFFRLCSLYPPSCPSPSACASSQSPHGISTSFSASEWALSSASRRPASSTSSAAAPRTSCGRRRTRWTSWRGGSQRDTVRHTAYDRQGCSNEPLQGPLAVEVQLRQSWSYVLLQSGGLHYVVLTSPSPCFPFPSLCLAGRWTAWCRCSCSASSLTCCQHFVTMESTSSTGTILGPVHRTRWVAGGAGMRLLGQQPCRWQPLAG